MGLLAIYLGGNSTKKPARPQLVAAVDLEATLGPSAYVGFTAGIFYAPEDHTLVDFSLEAGKLSWVFPLAVAWSVCGHKLARSRPLAS